MSTSEKKSRLKKVLLYAGIALFACVVTIVLFYAEEDLRGWQALKKAQAQLAREGLNLDWNIEIPAPVPDDQNVFGVPEMQKWFTGHGATEFSKKLDFLDPEDLSNRMTLARVAIGLPGATAPAGMVVCDLDDTNTAAVAEQRFKAAFGPAFLDPTGNFILTKKDPKTIAPVAVFLQCKTEPDEKAVEHFFGVLSAFSTSHTVCNIHIKAVRAGDGNFDLTTFAPTAAAQYLRWFAAKEPEMRLIREALQRPYARFQGDYSDPSGITIPNFVMMRAMAQRLATRVECDYLLGHTDDALDCLTFLRDLCQSVLVKNKPMTLVSAMINVAVKGLYATAISDGIKMHVWSDAQLAALGRLLTDENVLPPVDKAFHLEKKLTCGRLAIWTPTVIASNYMRWGNKPTTWMEKADLLLFRLIPRGWVWQNVWSGTRLESVDVIDGNEKAIYPERARAAAKALNQAAKRWSPYTFMVMWALPNFSRACSATAYNQTAIDHTLIACALERYHLAHRDYPAALEMLAPQYLGEIPHDVIGGQPPHYKRNGDGTFTLYSIGWDGKDHGGKPAPHETSDGDYVWPE